MKLPIIRRSIPTLIADDIAGVQPLTEEGLGFYFKTTEDNTPPEYGELTHFFTDGWKVFDGNDWIDVMRFIDIYGLSDVKCNENARQLWAQRYYNYCTTR